MCGLTTLIPVSVRVRMWNVQWVGTNSWQLWMSETESCPQYPILTTLLSSCRLSLWLLVWGQSTSQWVFPYHLQFPCINIFSREPCLITMCPKQESYSFVILPPVTSQASFAFLSEPDPNICSNNHRHPLSTSLY